jgi:signal transduction histidine kinase
MADGTLATVLDAAPCGVAVLRGADLVYELANPEFHRITSGQSLVGQRFGSVHPVVAARFSPIVREVLLNGTPFDADELGIATEVGVGAAPPQRFFSFRFRALPPDDRGAAAVLIVALETTVQVLGRIRAEALAALGPDMIGAPSVAAAVARALAVGREMLGGERAFALLADPDGDRLRGQVDVEGQSIEVVAEAQALAAGARAAEARAPQRFLAQETKGLEGAWLRRGHARSGLCVPMMAGAHVRGLLYVTLGDDRTARPEDLAFAQGLGTTCGLALERAAAFGLEREARAALQGATERLDLLAESGVVLGRTVDQRAVIRATAQLPLGYLADVSILDLADRAGVLRREAVEVAGGPASSAELPAADGREVTSSIVHQVLETTRPRRLVAKPEAASPPGSDPESALLRSTRASSCILAPLVVRGRAIGVLAVLRRAPARPHAQEDVLLAAEIARRAALALDDARLVAEAQDERRRREEFLSLAAHELRGPLTVMSMQLQSLLHTTRFDEPIHRRVQRAQWGAERLSRLVEQLLDALLANGEAIPVRREQLDLAAEARAVVEELSHGGSPAESAVRVEAPEAVLGWWDRHHLRATLSNLVANAVKFGEGRPVEVRVLGSDGVAQVEVRDHGIGLHPELRALIFEPYERGVMPRQYGGLGLGLWIARRFTEIQGGRLHVESDPGQGTTVRLELPREVEGPMVSDRGRGPFAGRE